MSDTIQRLDLSLDEVRTLVLEALRNGPETQYVNLCCAVAQVAVQKNIVPNPHAPGHFGGFIYLHSTDQEKVREIIWNLVVEGVLTLGINSSNPSWPWLKLTEYGRRVVNSTMPVPHDPSGYLNRIQTEIPNLDPIILRYLEESLRTYNINALLSSTITLGCASEKALLLLIQAYTNAINDVNRRNRFRSNTEGRMIKRQFDEFTKSLTGIIGNLPSDISDGLNNVLLGVFEMIRNYRNDAGHPTGRSIPKEHVFANLQVFIPYCKKIYQLIDHFNTNPI